MKALLLCEKPSAARRIARALDDRGRPAERRIGRVPYYEAERGEKRLIVVPALGHLYTVAPKVRDRNVYPVFDFEWVPRHLAERDAKEIGKWIEAISRLSKEADEFILATDYDIEGATLGYTILKYACGGKEKEAKRMKFSTLTTSELRESYADLLDSIEFPMIEAGICRHLLDAIYGINLSRAMTVAAKRWSGRYATLSTGRVQGPTLKFLTERERQINCFVPVPFWRINAKVQIDGQLFDVEYEQKIIKTQTEAAAIVEECKDRKGKIEKVEVREFRQRPPVPFDLGALQREAYSLFRYTPRRTADIAERLYLEALISYPRTSSQKLPPTINYQAILKSLGKEPKYRKLTSILLQKEALTPNEGKGYDPAHPAVYPTGNLPERKLSVPERRLWDLIVRRFMAVFGEPAVKQSVRVSIDINEHIFYLRGRRILKEGWILFYRPYVQIEDVILPPLEEGQTVEVKEISWEKGFTKPPARYNPSSLLKKMEDEGIGTKATRAEIIDTLYARGYVSGERAVVSELGLDVIDVLSRYCPEVISVEFTRDLEKSMEKIQNGGEKMEAVIERAVERLRPVLLRLKEHERQIGRELSEAIRETQMKKRILGICPVCGTGQLIILRSRRSKKRFVGCTNFFKGSCKTSFPLPQRGIVTPAGKACGECGFPMIRFKLKGRRPLTFCVNLNCPGKKGNA